MNGESYFAPGRELETVPIIAKDLAIPVIVHTSRRVARSLNCDGWHAVGLGLCLALLLVPLLGGQVLAESWRYQRAAIADGEWWRLASAHVVHLDARHAVMNALGLMLLWALFARSHSPRQWLLAVVITITAIDAGFWFLSPWLQWYVGASAVLHGVFACGCIAMIRRGDAMGIAAGVVFIAKLAWEQLQGPLPFVQGQPVVTISHLYGACGGIVAGLLLRARR